MAERNPIAFMSYVRLVDQHDQGRLSDLRARLEGEVRLVTGDESFAIFQDWQDIGWGEQWQSRIDESLSEVTFLIPVITPGFFKSAPCRREVGAFLKREKELGRTDLIFPVHYIDDPIFNERDRRGDDELMVKLAKHQYADWRELRHESLTSATIGRKLAGLAATLRDALEGRDRGSAPSDTRGTKGDAEERSSEQVSKSCGEIPQEAEPGEAAASVVTTVPEPPTVIVDPSFRGDHTSIGEAIKFARIGAKIMVRPGTYREDVSIHRPLEIVGQGRVDDVVIEAASRTAVSFLAPAGRIANLTIRGSGDKHTSAICISKGRLVLEDCDVGSRGEFTACVEIEGGDPRVRRNLIHGAATGVQVWKDGRGVLEDNEIFANRTGVGVNEGAESVLRCNRIHDNSFDGVNVSGHASLEDNDIFGNGMDGVDITGGVVARRNRICKNNSYAIRLAGNGRGTFEANDLGGNRRGAWKKEEDHEGSVHKRDNQE